MMRLEFDFRSRLVILFLTMALVAVLTSDKIIYSMLAILSIYLMIQGYRRQTVRLLAISLTAVALRVVSMGQGITVLMPDMFLFVIIRIMLMLMAAQPIMGMPPGEAVAVFKKMRAPDAFALPVTFMLRFLPTVKSEFSSVFAAMRMRGLLSLKKPLQSLEYILVPIMIRASKVSDELAASAEARGIASPGVHTCRRDISFQRKDWFVCICGVVLATLLILWEKAVIE